MKLSTYLRQFNDESVPMISVALHGQYVDDAPTFVSACKAYIAAHADLTEVLQQATASLEGT